jgi:MYXO-CTERM domain-containing protein
LDDAGNLVPAERKTFVANALLCSAQIEWIPNEPLKPNHTYRIVVQRTPVTSEPFADADTPDRADAFDSISFTTGDSALDLPAPTKPEIVTALLHPTNGASSCDVSSYQGCVATRETQTLEVITHWSGGVLASALVDQVTEISFAEETERNCLEVRARDATGRRSAPATLCATLADFTDVAVTSVSGNGWCHLNADGEFDSLPTDVTPADEPSTSQGCHLTPGISKSSTGQAFLGLLAALLLAWRRRPATD